MQKTKNRAPHKVETVVNELDLPEDLVVPDIKSEDESAIATEDDGEAMDNEVTLDDDELNPFGDKWEQ